VRFEVIRVVNIKNAAFWDVMPCSLVDGYQRFEGIFIFSNLKMETAGLVPMDQTTQCHIPEDQNCHIEYSVLS
jgi:hypothetical protein